MKVKSALTREKQGLERTEREMMKQIRNECKESKVKIALRAVRAA